MPHRDGMWYSGSTTVQILDKILIALKDGLPVIASLGYMMRISFGYGSRYSWHAATVLIPSACFNIIMCAVVAIY